MTGLFDLQGRVALVTGAGRGIGRAAAVALAEAGATVVAAARSDSETEQVAAGIVAAGGRASALRVDIKDRDDIAAMVAEVVRRHDRLDILVNNAGTNVQQHVLDVTEDAWEHVMQTNLKGAFFCAQDAGRLMVAQGSGKIINMASTFAVVGWPGRAVYAASKGALVQLTRVMALEWAPHGVNVNAVAPTAIHTSMNAGVLDRPGYQEEVLRRIPIGRFAEPADVVGAVVYLASPAADMVTGHVLLVDGGWTAI